MERTTLWNRDFGAYWLGLASAALGDALVVIALPFLVLAVSGDPRAIATTLLAASIARFAGPVVGALADRLPLRPMLVLAGVSRALLFGGMGALAVGAELPLAVVYLVAFLNGLVSTYVFAAGNVAVPRLVPQGELARANSLVQAALQGVPLLGLGVAGALVGWLGPAATLLLAAPLLGLEALFCALVRGLDRPGRGVGRHEATPFLRELAAGLDHLRRAGPLVLVLPLSLMVNVAMLLLSALMPVLMDRSGHGAGGYGLFEMTLSAAMLVGIGVVSVVGRRVAPQHGVSLAQVAMATGFGAMAVGGFPWLLAGAGLLGLGIGFNQVAAITLLQLAIPEGARGKVMGAIVSVNAVGQAAGAALSAAAADGLPPTLTFAASAGVVAACAAVWSVATLLGNDRLRAALARNAD